MRTMSATALALALSGCLATAPPPMYEMRNKFDPADYAEYMKTGNSTVTGQAFLRQQGGGTVTCAGNQVHLLPDTIFFREGLGILFMRQGHQIKGGLKDQDEKYQSLRRSAQCDAQGNFQFDSVPEGEYLITTAVEWSVGYSRQGGLLRKAVRVKGPAVRVLMSDADQR